MWKFSCDEPTFWQDFEDLLNKAMRTRGAGAQTDVGRIVPLFRTVYPDKEECKEHMREYWLCGRFEPKFFATCQTLIDEDRRQPKA